MKAETERSLLQPASGLSVDLSQLVGALRNAFAGIAVGIAFLFAVLCFLAFVLAYLGLVWGAVYWVGKANALRFILGATALSGIWWASFVASVLALDGIGVHLRGRFVYLCLPIAPALLALVAPLSAIAALGKLAGDKDLATPILGGLLTAAACAAILIAVL